MKKRTRCLLGLLALVGALSLSACVNEGGSTGTTGGTEHTHSYGEWTVVNQATCTEKGMQERVCACGDKQTQEIPATGHGATETRNEKAATCTEVGYTGDTYCTVCNEKLETGKEIAKLSHSYGDWTVVTEATCTADGLQERVCACGDKQTQNIPMLGHSYGAWTTVTEPTCTEKGMQERVCACGDKQTQEIPATGHGATEIRDEKAATCTEVGYTGDTYCTVCNEKLETGKEIAMIEHSYGAWTTLTEPTCTEKGEKERVCACGKKEIAEIPATGHVYGRWVVIVEETCTENGLKKHTCACGKTEEVILLATNHKYKKWEILQPATATEDGLKRGTCKCGLVVEEVIPATGELTLSLETQWENGELVAKVIVSGGAGVTNGKITVTYDESAFSMASVRMVQSCAFYHFNTNTDGSICVTWVGGSTAETQTLFTFTLTPKGDMPQTHIEVRLDEAYAGDMALTARPLSAQIDAETKKSLVRDIDR